jgi:hypothetical protein
MDQVKEYNSPQAQERRRQESEAKFRADLARASRQRFPFPVSSVQPSSGAQPLHNPDQGLYALANNYGGHNVYRSSDGMLVGFSAFSRSAGETHHFDAFGNRIR